MKLALKIVAGALAVAAGLLVITDDTSTATMRATPPAAPDFPALARDAATHLADHLRFETDGRVWVERSEGSDLAASSWGASLAGMAYHRYNQTAPGAPNGLVAPQIAALAGAYWDQDSESQGYAASLGDRDNPASSRYIDDGMWAANLRVQQYASQLAAGEVPDETALTEAQSMLDVARRNYDPATGLVFWKDQRQEAKKDPAARNHSLSTVSAAGAIELALTINRAAPEGGEYRGNLDFAMTAYDGLRRSMRDEDNLYLEGVHADGELNRAKYPYVQGMMLNIGGLLADATGQPLYLDEAARTATSALRFYDAEHLVTSDQMFVAIYFDRLYELQLRPTTSEPLRADIRTAILEHTAYYAALSESPVEVAPYGFRSAQLHMAALASLTPSSKRGSRP